MKFVDVEVKELDDQGRGAGILEGQSVSLPFTIPGEIVRVFPGKVPKGKNRTDPGPLEIRRPSPDRVQPPCPYYSRCGGCQLQHMSYERQLIEKEAWLRRLAAGVVEPQKIRPVMASPRDYHYRRRVQFQVGPAGEVGFYAYHSQKVVGIDACLLAQDAINASLPEVRGKAREILASPRRPTLLSFEVTAGEDGDAEIRLAKKERSFLQINPGANEKLLSFLESVLAEAGAGRALELFAGEGNLSSRLSVLEREWTAVESNPHAVAKGKNRLPRIHWVVAEVGEFLSDAARRGETWDVVLLDPPREGAKDSMTFLLKLSPARIVYISCQPKTLIRDLRALRDGGYEVEFLQPFDFFPQTMHLETVAVLSRPGTSGNARVSRDPKAQS